MKAQESTSPNQVDELFKEANEIIGELSSSFPSRFLK